MKRLTLLVVLALAFVLASVASASAYLHVDAANQRGYNHTAGYDCVYDFNGCYSVTTNWCSHASDTVVDCYYTLRVANSGWSSCNSLLRMSGSDSSMSVTHQGLYSCR